MSQTVDSRVVEMRFDNKQFESGVATTMTTLQKLKTSLNFSKVGDSFDVINKASNKVDMTGLDHAITGIQSKFSALEVAAITAISNITNSIVNAAKHWAAELTIVPIKSGFEEYETQINAVQTILANTQKEGTNIRDVNKALDELNLYADKTIYNFTEMTRNIGTFTAAGVDLETSTNAIQGIANLAAVSGSNSQQASTAMYQLSQALSAGAVKLQDWNSVVNAGMGGQMFQDALVETSNLLKTGASDAIDAAGSFRESLKKGWLTSEVLTETLKKFTTSGAVEYVANYTGLTKELVQSEWDAAKSLYGETEAIDKAAQSLASKSGKNADEIAETLRFAQTAEDAATKVKTFSQLIDTLKEGLQSGWSQSFRIIVGDFEEAKKLFTEISDSFGAVISASADARNKLLTEGLGRQGYKEYIAEVVGVEKSAIEELQNVARTAGTASDMFKESLSAFTHGDETLGNVVSHMIEISNTQQDVISYISDMTGMEESSIQKLQELGKQYGYASEEFRNYAKDLSEGEPEMATVITRLLEMNDAIMAKPSGRELLIDSLRNSLKGLVSVIKPVQEAFREVFPPMTGEQLYKLIEGFHEFTKTLILSEKGSEKLKKAFKGIFDVAKLLRDGFVALLKAILPIGSPISALGGGILTLAGSFGELLSRFSEAIRSSNLVRTVFEYLSKGSAALFGGLTNLIKITIEFVRSFSKMDGTVRIVNSLRSAFENLSSKTIPYIRSFVQSAKEMLQSLFNFDKIDINNVMKRISNAFSNLARNISGFSLGSIGEIFDKLKEKIQSFLDLLMSNKGLGTFVENFKKYGEELKEAFTLDNLLERLEKIMDVFGRFFTWIKSVLTPAIEGFDFGSAIAGAGGLGFIYAIVKATSAFDKVADALSSIPDLLGGVKDTLEAYQKNLKAEAILKISAAIGVLAASLVLLSFADTDRLMSASKALSLIAGTLLLGITALLNAFNKGREMENAAYMFSKGMKSIMRGFGWSLTIKAIGKAVKNFAESVAIIAVSIIALGIMYNKDKDALMAGSKMVGIIAAAMVGIMAGMSILGNLLKGGGMVNFAKAALGILTLSASLSLVVATLNKLFKMEFPSDWEFKLSVLVGILAGLGILAMALGMASRLSGDGKTSSMTILSMAAFLMVTIMALDKLFKMEFPPDWQEKLTVMGLIFAGFGALMITMGLASKLAGGAIKAAGTILSMAVFVGVLVVALMVLSAIPGDKLLKGATAIGIVLTTLALALVGASKVSDENTAKTVLAMAVVVGAIAASLVFLSFIKFTSLLKAVVALGTVLITVAESLKQAAKITNSNSWASILLMITAVLAISYSLVNLAQQPWQGMIAGAISLSAVLLSMSVCFGIIGKTKPDLVAMGTFLAASVSVGIIALAIYELSTQPWQNLLGATASLSLVLVSMSAAIVLCSVAGAAAGAALVGIAVLDTFIANFAFMLMALGQVYQSEEARALMNGGIEFLTDLGRAIGGFVGGIVEGVLTGVSNSLPAIGAGLSGFMENLDGFIKGSKNIDESVLTGVGILAACIIAITAAEVISGIGFFLGGAAGLVNMASSLVLFIETLDPFLQAIKGIDSGSIEAVKMLAEMVIIITAAEMLNGIGRFFGLSGSLADFGKQLAEFGPHIKQFAEDVKDVRAESVQGAASAAEIMAEVAKKLPGTEGLAQKIFGEKSLAEFGKELVSFGPHIKQFAEQVKDVNPEAVKGAASAAEIMAEVAEKLPPQGGLASKLFGERSLSQFGEELVKFGPKINQFANQVKNIDPSAVTGAASAAGIMSDLANNLPSSETLWNKIFGGGQVTLSQFGEELVKFGTSMSNFSSSVSGINNEQINGAIESFKQLVNLATSIQGISATDLVNFSNQLGQVSIDAVNRFIQAFTDAGPKASTAINAFANCISNSFITAMQSKEPVLLSMIKNLCTSIINQFQTSLPQNKFTTFGQNIVQWIVRGMDSKKPDAIAAAKRISTEIINAFKQTLTQDAFREIGANAALGLKYGIESKIDEIASSARSAAREAIRAAKDELDEHSPSKVAFGMGEFFSIGLANGITNQVRAISIAAKEASGEATSSAKDAFSGIGSIINDQNLNLDPVIRPVMDLSSIYQGFNEIASMMNQTYDLSPVYNKAMDVSATFARSRTTMTNEETKANTSEGGNTYEFIQNNYSPKALTRSEIYRDTNNQFAAFRRMVNPND